ncbi:HIT-like protein [Sparassis latifolia]
MTSFLIKAHEDRSAPSAWRDPPDCAFCRIIRGESPAALVFENDKVIAILDILPLRPGHVLVIPKAHYSRVSELPAEFAAATGEAISKVSNALTHAMRNTALNVVCNQEYAQAVPHVHYHVIPAPVLVASSVSPPATTGDAIKVDRIAKPLTEKEMHKEEFRAREELDYEDGQRLAQLIRAHL